MSYLADLVNLQDDKQFRNAVEKQKILVADVAAFSLASVKIFVLPQ